MISDLLRPLKARAAERLSRKAGNRQTVARLRASEIHDFDRHTVSRETYL
jgi:hypothetical protein